MSFGNIYYTFTIQCYPSLFFLYGREGGGVELVHHTKGHICQESTRITHTLISWRAVEGPFEVPLHDAIVCKSKKETKLH